MAQQTQVLVAMAVLTTEVLLVLAVQVLSFFGILIHAQLLLAQV
jgi:hypothetical protein